MPPSAAAVALIALLQVLWLYRARTTRRWRAALDAYAAREIARDRRRKGPPLSVAGARDYGEIKRGRTTGLTTQPPLHRPPPPG
jgi:hypothetical protein